MTSLACPQCGAAVERRLCGACGCATTAGRFVVERVLARSGQSRTYLARGDQGERVFLKELTFSLVPDESAIAAFEREGELLKQLSHPDIPGYVAHFAEGEGLDLRLYLAERYLEGVNLLDELEQRRYSEAEVKALAAQVLDVLSYLHERTPPVFHRDLKPANLIRRSDGKVSVVDFGSARDAASRTPQGMTQSGTIGYAPPEQLVGTVSPSSDVYALAATLEHLLTRQPPWERLENGLEHHPRALGVSAGFAAWFRRALDPRPSRRFGSARDAKAALIGRPVDVRRLAALGARAGGGVLALVAVIGLGSAMAARLKERVPHLRPPMTDELCPRGAILNGNEDRQQCQLVVGDKLVSTGLSVKYQRLGTKSRIVQELAHYANDVLEGPFAHFDYSGQKDEYGVYVAGKREGPWVTASEGSGAYLQGKRQGPWVTRVGGVLASTSTWADGQLDGVKAEYKLGVKETETTYRAGKRHGPVTTFFANGKPSVIDHFADDRREGEHLEFRPDGTQTVKGQFLAGLPTGVWTTSVGPGTPEELEERYGPDGHLVERTSYTPSHEVLEHWLKEADGRWNKVGFDEQHRKVTEFITCGDQIAPGGRQCTRQVDYWPSGAKKREVTYANSPSPEPYSTALFDGPDKAWFENGALSHEGSWWVGRRVRLWRTFWPNKRLQSEQTHVEKGVELGQKTGEQVEYFENGQLKRKGSWRAEPRHEEKTGVWVEYTEQGQLVMKETFP